MIVSRYANISADLDLIWEKRDRRVDGWFLMDSFWPTVALCTAYVYIVKIGGPNYMKDRKPFNITKFLIAYNAFQVILSTYIFVQVLEE